jgi:hypothetical protein
MKADRLAVYTSVAIALVTLVLSGYAAAERSVVRVEEGITVEEESEPGRALPILIGSTTMKASPPEILAWLSAVHTYVDWQHSCEEARVLPQPDGSSLTYNRIGSPWPVSDRDVVLRTSRENLANGGIRVEFRNIEDADFAAQSGVVRMPRMFGSYVLTPNGNGETHIVYTVDSDPGGSLPGWLVRQAAKNLPFNTLKNLRERAEAGPPPPGPGD